MKIAVASDDGTRLASHTGRCRLLVVFELENGSARRIEDRPNTFTAHARGECEGEPHAPGAGHHSHAGLVEALSDCRALVTRGMGRRLMEDLSAAGIEAAVCTVDGVEDAAALYAQGRLPLAGGTGCGRHE